MRTSTTLALLALACAGCHAGAISGTGEGMRDAAARDGVATTDQRGGTTGLGDAATSASDGGNIGTTGNPNGACAAGVPTRGAVADVSNPTTVVGTGV